MSAGHHLGELVPGAEDEGGEGDAEEHGQPEDADAAAAAPGNDNVRVD